jgi:hypothetical protein
MEKQTIRLTDADLHRIIKESVKTILMKSNINERIKSEKGMTDDEVRLRRYKNYMDDRNMPKDIYDRNFPRPDITDFIEEPSEGWESYFDRERINRHRAKQYNSRDRKGKYDDDIVL